MEVKRRGFYCTQHDLHASSSFSLCVPGRRWLPLPYTPWNMCNPLTYSQLFLGKTSQTLPWVLGVCGMQGQYLLINAPLCFLFTSREPSVITGDCNRQPSPDWHALSDGGTERRKIMIYFPNTFYTRHFSGSFMMDSLFSAF